MKTYKCKFPGCDYETKEKSLIDIHHIVPRELGGSNKEFNLIEMCPCHHRKIYIEESSSGPHSKKHEDSIVILNVYKSTNGDVLHFKDSKDTEYSYHYYNNMKVNWED